MEKEAGKALASALTLAEPDVLVLTSIVQVNGIKLLLDLLDLQQYLKDFLGLIKITNGFINLNLELAANTSERLRRDRIQSQHWIIRAAMTLKSGQIHGFLKAMCALTTGETFPKS